MEVKIVQMNKKNSSNDQKVQVNKKIVEMNKKQFNWTKNSSNGHKILFK